MLDSKLSKRCFVSEVTRSSSTSRSEDVSHIPSQTNSTTEKTSKLASLTFSNCWEALKNSRAAKTFGAVTIVVGSVLVGLVLAGVMATPPGWVLGAAAVAVVAITVFACYLQNDNDRVMRELSPLLRRGFNEVTIPKEKSKLTNEQQSLIRKSSATPLPKINPLDSSPKETLPPEKGKIYLGTMPNKLSHSLRKKFEEEKEKITKVLSVVEDWESEPMGFSIPWTKNELESYGIEKTSIEVPDHTLLTIEQLNEAADTIYDTISKGESIYVHCKAGQGRSPTAVAAYLMKYEGYTVDDVITHIKSCRQVATITNKKTCLQDFALQCPFLIKTISLEKEDRDTSLDALERLIHGGATFVISSDTETETIDASSLKLTEKLRDPGNLTEIGVSFTQEKYPDHVLLFLTDYLSFEILKTLESNTTLTVLVPPTFPNLTTLKKSGDNWEIEFTATFNYMNDKKLERIEHTTTSITIPHVLPVGEHQTVLMKIERRPSSNIVLYLMQKFTDDSIKDYQSAAEKIHSYEKGVSFSIPIISEKNHIPEKSEICSRIDRDLDSYTCSVTVGDSTANLEKPGGEIQSIKDQLTGLIIPDHILYLITQKMMVDITKTIMKDASFVQLNMFIKRPEMDRYAMKLEKIDTNWKLTTDCTTQYIIPLEEGEGPNKLLIDKAKWHCEALIPDELSSDAKMELHFWATPLDEISEGSS